MADGDGAARNSHLHHHLELTAPACAALSDLLRQGAAQGAAPGLRGTPLADGWAVDSRGGVLLALHPEGSCLAAALGPHLCICPLHASPLSAGGGDDSGVSGAERHASHGHASTSAPAAAAARQGAAGGRGASTQAPLQPQHHPAPTPVAPVAVAVVPCPDDITSLAWIAFARPRRGGSGGGGSVFGSVAAALEQGEQELMQRRGAAGGGLLVCLLAGTSSGWLQLHDEAGAMLLRQHLHAGPLRSIHCRTWRMGLKPDGPAEDITLAFPDAIAHIPAWELRTCLHACLAARLRRASSSGATRYGLWGGSSSSQQQQASSSSDVPPLAVQRWEVPRQAKGRVAAVCCGQRPRDLYALLQGIGSSPAACKLLFLAAGEGPCCVAAVEVDDSPAASGGGWGPLGLITGVASHLTWGASTMARTARSVAAAPWNIAGGIRQFVANPLQLAPSDAALYGGGATGAGAGAAGGLWSGQLQPPQQPLASIEDPAAGRRPPACGAWRMPRDDGRSVASLAPAPSGALVAAVDNLGRVLLLDASTAAVVRMWKGYRDAQVAWLEVPRATLERWEQQRQQEQEQAVGLPQPQAAAQQASSSTRRGPASWVETAATSWEACWDGEGEDEDAALDAIEQSDAGRAGGQDATGGTRSREPGPGDATDDIGSSSSGTAAPSPEGNPLPLSHGTVKVQGQGQGQERGRQQLQQLLVMYAPRRQSLELWAALQGRRLWAVQAPARARLLQGGACSVLGTWGAGADGSAASMWHAHSAAQRSSTSGVGHGVAAATACRMVQGTAVVDVASLFGLPADVPL